MKRHAITAAILASAAFAAPAMAQDVGASILGNDDAAVGTVLSNDGTTVVVDTGTHRVPLGMDAFAEADGVYTLNTTKADLDTAYGAMLAEQQAALDAALVVGAEVKTADQQVLGPVTEVLDDGVVVTHMEQPFTLPLEAFTVDQDGALMVMVEMAVIMEALGTAG
ncbi:MAG: hypothetical protein WBA68_07435 [Alteraurantiacibacter sp.]